MTKTTLRSAFAYYAEILYDRAISGKIASKAFGRLSTKLDEWEEQLSSVTLRNGCAIRYTNEEAAQ